MNAHFLEILRASEADRRGLLLSAAARLGTAVQHVEKDFWVCWTLDAMFNGLSSDSPRLLFKGGTSLSKSFGLIDRFSEDIDITVFRDDLGQPATVLELEQLSGKQRQRQLDAIKASCHAYITGDFLRQLGGLLNDTMEKAGVARDSSIVVDEVDPDRQTLLFWYPSALAETRDYIQPAVRIEAGAKSALDPHQITSVLPYVATDIARLNLRVANITSVSPERTFWDKVVILHGQRSWFERRGVLRADGHRISRHYYDAYRLMRSDVGPRAVADRVLGIDCARHARMFFSSADLDLPHAVPGSFALVPPMGMRDALRRDYNAMTGMIFGVVPSFDAILTAIEEVEATANAASQ
jgi:hypothetical protein